jgi:hypothetical protein
MFLLFKLGLSALLIVLISELGKRQPTLAALVASLPLVSVLAMGWMHIEGAGQQRIAAHAEATFWYVLPSLPMFLLLPALLRHGVAFPYALLAGVCLTAVLYLLTIRVAALFGVSL